MTNDALLLSPTSETAFHQPASRAPALSIRGLTKTYDSGFKALDDVSVDIPSGEIFALLGPNGAGKTTLISIACGLVNATAGAVSANGHDIVRDFRAARRAIGLVPQELSTDSFETVLATVTFTRGLFGRPPDPALIERILRDLTLWDKRSSKIMTLSGGMKRRVMIAKALAHEPRILFLDEPTAGVDVELRRDMWDLVRQLRASGVTIVLTTHYIEEAEEMADRVGVINRGKLILVEEKAALMRKLGRSQLRLTLAMPLEALPHWLQPWSPDVTLDGAQLVYSYIAQTGGEHALDLLRTLDAKGVKVASLETRQSSLEDIFVDLVQGR